MNRKDFIRTSGAALLLASLGIPLQSCSSDEEDEPQPVTPPPTSDGGGADTGVSFNIQTSPFNVLENPDAWLLHPTEDILVVNAAGTLRAFTSVCTHSACSRNWSFSGRQARCNCHGSIFDQAGGVVQGPANRSLTEYGVSRDGDTITINK
ncbi:MAG: ubiquinol-cytochrome c reductase iron-sulfur subunit [Bernardetiaceae bacterium]